MADRRKHFNPIKGIGLSSPDSPLERGAPSRTAGPSDLYPIASEPQALDVIGNAKPFVLVGNEHTGIDDFQNFVDLIPTLARAHVAVIGVEEGPSINPVFKKIQDKLRNGGTLDDAQKMLVDYYSARGAHFFGGDAEGVAKTAALLMEATKNGIKVVGIDARLDDKNFMAQYRRGRDGQSSPAGWDQILLEHDKFILGHDAQMAAIAAAHLAEAPRGSRMAIFYGFAHGNPQLMPQPGTPLILGQCLQGYGGATVITPAGFTGADEFGRPLAPSLNKIDGPKLRTDIDTRHKVGGEPQPTKIKIDPSIKW